MNRSARFLPGLLIVILLIAGGWALLGHGFYGWTLFVLLPVAMGAVSAWIFRPATGPQALRVGALTVVVACGFLLALGKEGLICIAMALPLGAPLGAFGAWLVYRAQSSALAARGVTMIILLPPASLNWDAKAPPRVFEVRSRIEVAAAPEQVWKYVVSFPEIEAPPEWFFRAGIAYPRGTRIVGSGPGAARYCDLSTGPVVESVEIWDEPRRLEFRVLASPAPMRELSPYAEIAPKHLHGYFLSERGRFELARLPNGHTLIEGTSWYQHGLWPAEYWRWWSDAIIHRIHMRVLDHIRTLAESER